MRVRGAVRTRESFLGSIVDPYLAPSLDEPQTLGTVLRKTKEMKSLLEETDLFIRDKAAECGQKVIAVSRILIEVLYKPVVLLL